MGLTTKSDELQLSSPLVDHSQDAAIKRTGLPIAISSSYIKTTSDFLLLIFRHNMDSSGPYHHRSDRLRRAVPGMEHGAVRLDCRPFLDAVFRSHHSHLIVSHEWLLPIPGPRAWPHQEQIIHWSCWAESWWDSWSLLVLLVRLFVLISGLYEWTRAKQGRRVLGLADY